MHEKKALIAREDIPYQTILCKSFPEPISFNALHIQFYHLLKESSENALSTVIALKSVTFSAPETALETMYFMLFLKN